MKDSRSPEDFVLPFVTCTVKTVKKSPYIPPQQHNAEVNDQIRQFVEIMRLTVAQAAPQRTDVLQRLDGYLTSMEQKKQEANMESSELPSEAMQMAATALKVFDVNDESEVKKMSRSLRAISTAKNAVKDIQLQLDLLAAGHAVFTDSPDFLSTSGYDTWARKERESLEERKRYYQGFVNNRASVLDFSGADANGSSSQGHGSANSLTFIPLQPRTMFLELLRRCLDLDLDNMANLSDTDMVSLAILSEPHILLLDEVAGHWRITQATKLAAHASLLVDLLTEDGVPIECVAESLNKLRTHVRQTEKDTWLREDVSLESRTAFICM